MSVEAMAVALHHSKASGSAKLVLIGIANHLGDGGAWPSMGTLAKYASVDKRGARRAVERLESLGEIRREVQAGGTGDILDAERPNLYHFLLTCPESCDRTTAHRSKYSRSLTIAEAPRAEMTGGALAPGGGRALAPSKPSKQPSTKTPKITSVGDRAGASACPEDSNGQHRYGPGGFCTNGCGIELGARA